MTLLLVTAFRVSFRTREFALISAEIMASRVLDKVEGACLHPCWKCPRHPAQQCVTRYTWKRSALILEILFRYVISGEVLYSYGSPLERMSQV